MSVRTGDWEGLQDRIAGEVILPGSPGYELARSPAIPRFRNARPAAVVRCGTPADVAETISLARRRGLRVAPRSGGHCFAGRSSTEGIVIDVSPMRSVSVGDGSVTVGAGARLGEIYDALGGHGRTIAAGCGPGVGIAGLTLGGGLGILGRSHGLTCDQLLAARVVLADGRVIDCDDRRDPDLFWALRGSGGSSFGVVTSLTFSTIPAPPATSFHLVWPHRRASKVIEAWQEWACDAPDELAASLLVTAGGDPGREPVANLFGVLLGTERAAGELLGDVVARVGADPASAVSQHLPYRDAKRYLAELGDQMAGIPPGQPSADVSSARSDGTDADLRTEEEQSSARSDGTDADRRTEEEDLFIKSEFFARPLPAEAIGALADHLAAGRVPGQARELDFTPWGGAFNRVPAGATAFAHRDARFLLKHAIAVPAGQADAARGWLDRSWAAAHPWGTGGVYPNFPDPDLGDWPRAYHGTNYGRLTAIKARYDPGNFFRFRQSVPPG